VQAGRAIFDLDRGVYRKRELTREPLPLDKLRFANEREQSAALLHEARSRSIVPTPPTEGFARWARKDRDRVFAPLMTFDVEQRLVAGECTCDGTYATGCIADRASTCSRCAPRIAAASTTRSRSSRGWITAVARRRRRHARELSDRVPARSAAGRRALRLGRNDDSIAELERISVAPRQRRAGPAERGAGRAQLDVDHHAVRGLSRSRARSFRPAPSRCA
jgi:hypothetical protein